MTNEEDLTLVLLCDGYDLRGDCFRDL